MTRRIARYHGVGNALQLLSSQRDSRRRLARDLDWLGPSHLGGDLDLGYLTNSFRELGSEIQDSPHLDAIDRVKAPLDYKHH